MIEKEIKSHDGIAVKYAVSELREGKPWIALAIPFGLQLKMAEHFFAFFSPQYNVVCWEARSIIEDSDRPVEAGEFSIENHVMDLYTVLQSCPSDQFIMVGYCSGAGVGLAAANRFPQLFSHMILVHGEYVMLDQPGCTTLFAQEIDSLLTLAGKDEEHLQLIFKKIQDKKFDENSGRPEGLDIPFSRLSYLRRHSANYLSYKTVDFVNMARFVTHKALVMIGEKDVQVNVESAHKIIEQMPNAQLYIDPEADHYGVLRSESNTMVTIWNYLYQQQQLRNSNAA